MNASRSDDGRRSVLRDRHRQREIHVSGAEGIHDISEIPKIVKDYCLRALRHTRGKPDRIVITVEEIGDRIRRVPLLPVITLSCASPDEARKIIGETLSDSGISRRAIRNAFGVLQSRKTMRGASLILMESGGRREPDRDRGVRVSRLGVERSSIAALAHELSRTHLNTSTVKEALILASKVAGHPCVEAEICLSDDPDYTTGYLASSRGGYMRIPNIKHPGELHGGRVFFIREDTDVPGLMEYLERTPVLLYLNA